MITAQAGYNEEGGNTHQAESDVRRGKEKKKETINVFEKRKRRSPIPADR